MKIEIDEKEAELVRMSLMCYREACNAHASYGSPEFLNKVNEIQEFLDRFRSEVDNAEQGKSPDDAAREAAETFENAKERFQVAWGQLVQWWNDNPGLKALGAQLASLQEPKAPEEPTEADSQPVRLCAVCGRLTRIIHTAAGDVLIHRTLPADRHNPMTVDYEEMNKP